ncbi:MAG: hypothetical protein EBX40_05290, partial [Gammaproteobacteria bacterium]|nr:hypothetical protein [Gammaproteobacteria bacterium]
FSPSRRRGIEGEGVEWRAAPSFAERSSRSCYVALSGAKQSFKLQIQFACGLLCSDELVRESRM